MPASPELFCTPAVFALMANVFHISEMLLAPMTAHLLESVTDS